MTDAVDRLPFRHVSQPGPLKVKAPDELPISESFVTLQGEGRLSGRPSYFLRTTLCNLRCAWGETACDSAYTSHEPEGEIRLLTDIVEEVRSLNVTHVVITGGEPAMWPEQMSRLMSALKAAGIDHITIETNGTLFIPFLDLDLVSISPKLRSSTPESKFGFDERTTRIHEHARLNIEAFQHWIQDYDYQLKFVVYEEADLEEIEHMIHAINALTEVSGTAILDESGDGVKLVDPTKVFLMPEGITPEECWERARWMVPYCIEKNYSLAPRIHLDLFGCTRAT